MADRFLTITNLRGGLNDLDPPLSLEEDQCTIAENVEFYYSTLGERRLGCVGINLPTSITTDTNLQAVTWLGTHLPSTSLGDRELWALAQSLTLSNNLITRRTTSGWSTVTPLDTPTTTAGRGHRLSGVSLHGKFFLGYKSAQDRLHVWDGSTLRRVGLAPPALAPTATNTGGGTYASTRYFRVRYVVMSGSTVLRRSEPSPVLTFIPSGAGTGAIVTKPATIGEGETHWELEASTDNANFYMIVRTVVGTTTVTDSTAFATGYSTGVLSEDLTAYTTVPSGKFLTVDSDRLLIAGSWENTTYSSRVWWTPVFGNTGVGNDERLDMTTNPYIDLDGFEGGEITGISRAMNGYLYVFKFEHIYKVVRTGQRASAYSAIPLTKARGALPGSVVEAVDESGAPAIYFLDPKIGPMRIGANGPEWCGRDIATLWLRVNQSASVPAHGVFYQHKNQVHFWVALDGSDYPCAKIVLHVDRMFSDARGAHKGWVTVPIGNRIADAHCSVMFSDNIDSTDARSQNLVPFIGKEQWSVDSSTLKLEVLVVGGGGGGGDGGASEGGGGGAGGYLEGTLTAETKDYVILVGHGGNFNGNGISSIFGNCIATGGGAGGANTLAGGVGTGPTTGGSGGGAGGSGAGAAATQANSGGLTGYGNAGGAGSLGTQGGGGGGAGGAGTGGNAGTGGVGRASSITGASVTYAAGGTGSSVGGAGAPNTGNGGNGGNSVGGSGIVVVRYLDLGFIIATGGTITTSGGYKIHTFTTPSVADTFSVQVIVKNIIQRCDTGTTDALILGDVNAYYYAKIKTKPFTPVGIQNKCGILSCTLAAEALDGAANALYIKGVKDFGKDEVLVHTVFIPSESGEEITFNDLDNLSFSEARAVQFEFGDLNETILPTASWRLHAFGMKVTPQQTS